MAITNGSSLDVIEIDAASNRGVDDIRALRDGVRLATAGARKKVYIIDEAHMLTTEASNALLKTLEEPPAHVVFVLATTSAGKLLDTIRSRCTTVTFFKAGTVEIIESLKRVVGGEKLEVEDGVLEEISRLVDGSFREAHKLLEQVSLGKEKVTLEDIRRGLSTQNSSIEPLVSALVSLDIKGALVEIDRVSRSGADLKQYTTSIVSVLREILLAKFVPALQGVSLQGYEARDLGGVERVREGIELFSVAANQIPTSVISQLPLELAVVKWVGGGSAQTIRSGSNSSSDEASGNTSRERRGARTADFVPLEVDSDTKPVHKLPVVAPPERKEKEKLSLSESGFLEDDLKKVDSLSTGEIVVGGDNGLEEKWKLVMREVKPKNHSIEALLRATRPRSYDGKILTIEVFYKFHKERIEKDPYRSLVEEIATQILGAPVRLDCLLSESQQKARDIVNLTETVEDDIVRAAEDIFGVGVDQTNKLPN